MSVVPGDNAEAQFEFAVTMRGQRGAMMLGVLFATAECRRPPLERPDACRPS